MEENVYPIQITEDHWEFECGQCGTTYSDYSDAAKCC